MPSEPSRKPFTLGISPNSMGVASPRTSSTNPPTPPRRGTGKTCTPPRIQISLRRSQAESTTTKPPERPRWNSSPACPTRYSSSFSWSRWQWLHPPKDPEVAESDGTAATPPAMATEVTAAAVMVVSTNGAPRPSPGQRPGSQKPKTPSPVGAPHHGRLRPSTAAHRSLLESGPPPAGDHSTTA